MKKSLVVISSYPSQGSIHDSQTVGVASYTKLLLTELVKITPQLNITVLAEEFEHSKIPQKYRERGITVDRIWQRNHAWNFISLWQQIQKLQATEILVSFEAYMFGNLLMSGIFLVLLSLLRLQGKQVTFLLHQVPSSLDFLEPNWFKSHILTLSRVFFFTLLRVAASKIIVFETGLTDHFSHRNITVLPHLIVPVKKINQREAQKKLGWKTSQKYVLYFGYLAPYKGVDWLVKHWPISSKMKLIIAGDINPNHIRNQKTIQFVQKVKAAAHKKSIFLTGFVPEKEIDLYFSAVDTVILPYQTFMSSSGPLALALAHEKTILLSNPLQKYFATPDFRVALKSAHLSPKNLLFPLTRSGLQHALNSLPKKSQSVKFAQTLQHSRDVSTVAKQLYATLFKFN